MGRAGGTMRAGMGGHGMQYWLIKSEPGTYGWADLVRDGKTRWDGVRNFQARNHLRAMRPGDLALFYHSVSERSIPGVARVIAGAYPDPTARDGDWSAVDVEPAFPLRTPVTLDDVKRQRGLRDMVLLKQSRLSVQPVTKAEFDAIVALGGR
jgi:predicted RNA-binding protein with PUA-like domain